VRRLGVEEELLLVDATTGRPSALASTVLERFDASAGPRRPSEAGRLEAELQQQQIELATAPVTSLLDLDQRLRAWRRRADDLAGAAQGRVVAVATSPVPVAPELTMSPRYRRIAELFALTASEQLTCGCHVHVEVASPEEGAGVLDRIRTWLPVLIALSANSPYWQGRDSGYASYRYRAWTRFPTAGPTPVFGSHHAYRSLVASLLATNVPMDHGMIYFDARLSVRYPTVEVRVSDVCLRAEDTVTLAGLVRALVETAAREWSAGAPPIDLPAEILTLASWRASRSGIDADLLDPVVGLPRPAATVVEQLLHHVRGALGEDLPLVEAGLERILGQGTGAHFQRRHVAGGGDGRSLLLAAADMSQA
jgi:glutamate---cysteine ligase / carboxylate-amine ligase